MKKVSNSKFTAFKRDFKHWQKELGLMEYTITFEHKNIDASSECHADAEGKVATITLATTFDTVVSYDFIATCALHEALHLLLADLTDLSAERFTSYKALERAEEHVVCTLEKVIFERWKR